MSLKAKVKQTILDCLIHKCDREYDRTYQYAKKSFSYGNLVTLLEEKERCSEHSLPLNDAPNIISSEVFSYSFKEKADADGLRRMAEKADYVIFCEQECFLHKNAMEEVASFLSKNPDVLVLYGDEDVIDEKGRRSNPWLKPQWSPTLFLRQHYIGGLVVVRSRLILQVLDTAEKECKMRNLFYAFLREAGGYGRRSEKIAHLEKVLVHHPSVASYDKFLNCEQLSDIADDEEQTEMVSVVIPSKDQVEILTRNLQSLKRTVNDINPEVIIVDNGSGEENRKKIETTISDFGFSIKYIYEPMEFNFSAMCNRGAKESKGDILLFLNDDIEACEAGWLQDMVATARKEYVGCVGAKLLYPGTNQIQHAGVMNLSGGPVHKLQWQEDSAVHYFGWNKSDRECLAVTGACLMVRRELFEEAGGFDEELPVTFNDIDLCYKLYAKGYYNLCLNSIFLYHHESLSRGVDVSEEKKVRLIRERAKLYEKHTRLSDADPFYHRLLNRQTSDMRILPALDECMGLQIQETVASVWAENTWKDFRRHEGVRCGMETGKTKGYLLMLGDDNACYEKRLVLTNPDTGKTYFCKLNDTLREDIQQGMPDQKNIALSGFEVKIVGLPVGEYEIKAVAHNKITGVSYWKETEYKVSITEE